MFLVALLIIAPALFGLALFSFLNLFTEKISLATGGLVFGLSVFTTAAYAASLGRPISPALLTTIAGLMGMATIYLFIKDGWRNFATAKLDRAALVVFVSVFALCALIVPKLLVEKDGGYSTGILNAYGDIAWHMSNITMFRDGQSAPPQNPIFAGTRLTYPFLSNFFSATLLAASDSFTVSVVYPAMILIPAVLTLMYCLVRNFTGGNKTAAIISVLLMLFGGATAGWFRFGSDLAASDKTLFEFMMSLPTRDYSGVGTDDNGFHFLNPVTSLLLPQRSFLFGMPLALLIVLLLQPRTGIKDRHFIVAGIAAGLLPLFHAHTVLVMIPAVIAIFILNPGIKWLLFFLPAAIVGIPEVLYYAGGQQESGSFIRWGPGWMAGDENWFVYWLKNTGLLIPAGILGLFLKMPPRPLKALAGTGLILLAVGNLFLFAPWAWDNFKILVFWLIFTLPLVGYLISRLMKSQNLAFRSAAVIFIALHCASAGLDIWKLALPNSAVWGEWDQAAVMAAEQIRVVTNPGESILTAPIHNSPTALAGRPSYLGYAAHVWSHGGLPWDREKSIALFYQGYLNTLPELTPDYILIGPIERSNYGTIAVQPAWQLVAVSDGYQLFRLPK